MPKDSLKDKLDGNELDLSLNNLEVVPVKELAAIPRATHLDLSCNLLITLPDSFCTLTHLVKVDLSKNKLTELPLDFGQLENLQHLDLLGNQLTTLPESFSLLNKLKWLDLKDNPLDTGLKKNAGDCLDEKQCRACAQRILLYMKEVSTELEKKRQKKLKAQKDREAKQKAHEEEEARKKKELRKAEKERKRQEAQARKVPKKKADHSTDEEPAEGALTGDVAKKEKTETKKDKTGRGFFSCCLAMLSIFVVLLALVVGVAFHCSTSLKDRYCRNYYNPVQARVLQAANETHRQAGEVYQTVSTSSLQYYKVASAAVKDWYEASREFAHSLYASAVERMDGRGGEENRDSGGGGEKATKG